MTKRPTIYLLVILPVFYIGSFALMAGALHIYSQVYAMPISEIPTINTVLIIFPSIILWIPISLMLSNTIIQLIPKMKGIAENYTEQVDGPSYLEAQRQIKRISILFSVICIPFITMGFIL